MPVQPGELHGPGAARTSGFAGRGFPEGGGLEQTLQRPALPGVLRPVQRSVVQGKHSDVHREHIVSSANSTTFVHAAVEQKCMSGGGRQTRHSVPWLRWTLKVQAGVTHGRTPFVHMAHMLPSLVVGPLGAGAPHLGVAQSGLFAVGLAAVAEGASSGTAEAPPQSGHKSGVAGTPRRRKHIEQGRRPPVHSGHMGWTGPLRSFVHPGDTHASRRDGEYGQPRPSWRVHCGRDEPSLFFDGRTCAMQPRLANRQGADPSEHGWQYPEDLVVDKRRHPTRAFLQDAHSRVLLWHGSR